MWLFAETFLAQATTGWDYRLFVWIGMMLIVIAILFVASVAVFVGRERSQRGDVET